MKSPLSQLGRERHAKRMSETKQTHTHTVEEAEKRQTDGERETEGKGVSVERIYEWGLSVGYGPGPSVVHSSVIFTAPQAPMCLPVAAMYTHARTHTDTVQTRMYACTYRLLAPEESSHCTITLLLCHWAVTICSHFCLFFIPHLVLSVTLSLLIIPTVHLTLRADITPRTASQSI